VFLQRDDVARGESSVQRKAWVLGTVIALVALAVGSVFGDRGILNLVDRRRQVESVRQEIEALRADNARLAAEIVALRTNPRAVERLAREELGLARPDETVFLIREEPPAPDREGQQAIHP
jgi:cell division protein FtsB